MLKIKDNHLYIDGDYLNEVYSLRSGISAALDRKGLHSRPHESDWEFFSRIDDETLYAAIVEVRETRKVRTIEERYLLPSTDAMYLADPGSRRELETWITDHAERANQINAYANALNTTESVPEFKRAINGMCELCNKEPPFKIDEGDRTRPLRTRHPRAAAAKARPK